MMDFLMENILIVLIGIIVTAGFTGITGYFKKRTNCLQKVAEEVEELRKRSYRIEKTLVILTKLQEDVVQRSHPELKTEWEEIVKELLKGNGNNHA
jgi:hypothetical protein